jgi:site-specific recombinase XerD
MRSITPLELEEAAERWCDDAEVHKTKARGPHSKGRFIRCAKQWFAFHKVPIEFPSKPLYFADVFDRYIEHLHSANYAKGTIKGWKSSAKTFLEWLPERKAVFADVTLQDVDDFIAFRAAAGWSPSSIKTVCQGLRSLLRFAADRALCRSCLAEGIISPSTPLYSQQPKGPTWPDVRRVLARAAELQTREGARIHAILCLAAVYALRGKEIASLQLHDFDWYKETLTIRRAKRGRVQQYPLQYEVGEAVIRYLRTARPISSSRHVFLTVKAPYRPMTSDNLCNTVGAFLKATPSLSGSPTAHALRHACATKLLNQGSSLQYISHFLGHKDAKSVSIYARYDTRNLMEIAAFSLKGVL